MPDPITVIKQNPAGEETWRYEGRVLEHRENSLRLEAFFNRDDMPFHGLLLKRGDRFVETFFSDRWYNIFEIFDRDSSERKGWYCNVTRPAEIDRQKISYVDLALDLLVFADKRQLVLDEDEFAALEISPEEALTARQALRELQALFARHD
jgi:predicted RNA-binding protein associated with RNAse of E/G family